MQTPLKKTFNNPEYLSRSRKYDHQCVCDICNCGKHKCPEKGPKFQGQSTNSYYYKPYDILPQQREKIQQKHLQTHYDPELIQSSYKKTYTPHRIQRQRPIVYNNEHQVPKSKFQGESQYKKNYLPNKGKTERLKTSPVRQYIPNSAKFQDSTTYKREFSPKKADNTFNGLRKNNNYQPSTTPFQGQSSYDASFKPHKIQLNRPSTANRNLYTPNNNKFEGNTRYREFYQPYKIEPKQRCPTEYLPQRPSNCSPGKDHLHFSAEKDRWE